MNKTQKRLEQILPKIRSDALLNNRGRGGEIGFYIFDYDPKDELIVSDYVCYLMKQFTQIGSPVRPIHFDLYELMMEILKRKKVLDRIVPNGRKRRAHKVFKAVNQCFNRNVLSR